MKILVLSKDRLFCDQVRQVFARDGAVVRMGDRQAIWSRSGADDDVLILHSSNAGAAARWCRVVRRVRRAGPLMACCDVLDPGGVATVLNAGADDVMLSATPDQELLARTRAVCRRVKTTGGGQRRLGAIVIDSANRAVAINGVPVPLRRAEFRLLSYLIANADRVIGSRELIEDVLGGEHNGDSALIRVHLSQLRRKLGAAGSAIETVRGQGYRLVADATPGHLMKSA